MKKRSEFGLGSAFFGISDPGLVKKTFFKVFFHKKLTGASGDENLDIFVSRTFLWANPNSGKKEYLKKSEFDLGRAFFGICDPGLVKRSFFETFLSQKIDGSFWGGDLDKT